MKEATFYALRHKATGHMMPTLRGRGYSLWSPTADKPKAGIEDAFDVPRLFATSKGADNARVLWARGIHTRNAGTTYSLDGPDDYEEVSVEDVGRKKDDLEVVPMLLTPASRAVVHIRLSVDEQGKVMREAFERTLAEYKDTLADADRLESLRVLVRQLPVSVSCSGDKWQLSVGTGTTWGGDSFEKVIDNAVRDIRAMNGG